MVFLVDIAFVMELIALAIGALVIIKVKKNLKVHLGLARFIGYAVMILAVLTMICTSFYGTKYWFEGYFKKPLVFKDKTHMKWHKKAMRKDKKYKKPDKY